MPPNPIVTQQSPFKLVGTTIKQRNASHTFQNEGGRVHKFKDLAASAFTFTPAFLTGDTGAQGTFGTWAAVTDGSFRITINGVARNIDAIDFTGDGSMDDVAATIQAAIRAVTGSTETCVWSTNKFIITSADTSSSSAITVTTTSTGTVGTDISGAGASDWMDCDTGNGVATAKSSPVYNILSTDHVLGVSYSATAATSLVIPTAQLAAGRVLTIKDSGGLSATNNVTISTEGAETIDGGNTFVISTNYASVDIYSDGSNWFVLNPLSPLLPKSGGTMTGKIVSSGSSEIGKTYTPAVGAQSVAIDCALNNMHIVTGHADGTAITFTIANAVNNQPFIISILQGSGTVSTIAGWFATIRWAGGTPPTLTATLNKRDTFGFIRTGADTYDGFVIGQNA